MTQKTSILNLEDVIVALEERVADPGWLEAFPHLNDVIKTFSVYMHILTGIFEFSNFFHLKS